MGKKALVVYATRCGSTKKVAEIVAQKLSKAGYSTEVASPSKSLEVAPYNLVVIGSAIRAGKCMNEVESFAKFRSVELEGKKTALFVVCLTMKDDNDKTRSEVGEYFKPLEQFVKPISKGLFAGAMDYKKVPFVLRFLMKKMGAPEGDFMDPNKIEEWAAQIANM